MKEPFCYKLTDLLIEYIGLSGGEQKIALYMHEYLNLVTSNFSGDEEAAWRACEPAFRQYLKGNLRSLLPQRGPVLRVRS